MPRPEDAAGWLPELATNVEEASDLAHTALEQMNAGKHQEAVDTVARMRVSMTHSTNAVIGFLAEMHFQGVEPTAQGPGELSRPPTL